MLYPSMPCKYVIHPPAKPCALLQQRGYCPLVLSSAVRRYASSDSDHAAIDRESIQLGTEQTQHLLQHYDQKTLRETKKLAKDFIEKTRVAKERMAAIPTTVNVLPEVPVYTLGSFKGFIDEFQRAADETTVKAGEIIQHLEDLQFEPYKGKDENEMVKFEKRIETLNLEELEEMRKQIGQQEDAMRSRASMAAGALVERVNKEVVEDGGTVRKMRNPFDSGGPDDDDVEQTDENDAAESRVAVSSAGKPRREQVQRVQANSRAPQVSLLEIQAALQASVSTQK